MFFTKKEDKSANNNLSKIAALLIHAAKIDENFSLEEEIIIKKALEKLDNNNQNIEDIIKKGKLIEENSNQILDFTRVAKNMDEKDKIKIVETLWQIIYSNNEADIYETNLMRRLGNLMYIDNKLMGDIKENIRKKKITDDIYRK
tara:strand:- start:250 stop:684 length:435 start_codon:yes stop_codon:yes gene_type:complete